MATPRTTKPDEPILDFADLRAWLKWLKRHHATSGAIWLRIAKRGGPPSVTYAEAVEGGLIWGWIDSQKAALDDTAWLQRFSRRTSKSPWSRINREKAEKLLTAGRLEAPGRAAIEEARADGRWDRAYPGARSAEVPADLSQALSRIPRAKRFFEGLDGANRFAILVRLHNLKTAKGRENAIQRYVDMCSRGETLHAPRGSAPNRQSSVRSKTKSSKNR